jgi:small subunit ribosomal protein S6
MRRYESVVILDPDLGEDDVHTFADRYSEVIKTNGGEVIKVDDWGIKRLAYLVKKREKGRYILFDFAGNPALIEELERQFKISEEVMKFLSVKLDADVDLEAVRAAAQAKAASEAPPAVVEEEAAAPTEGAGEALPVAEEAAVAPTEGADAPPPEVAAEASPEGASVQPETPTEEVTASAEQEPAPAEAQTDTAEEAPGSQPGKEAETK